MHPKVAEPSGFDDISDNQDEEYEVTGGVERYLGSDGVVSHPASMEQEKRIRREVANSNERRRMQSINAGFLTLRAMLPQREGEKLSKAAILQQTSDFICNLEQEKTRLLTQNCQLKRLLGPQSGGGGSSETESVTDGPASGSPVRRSVSQEEEEVPCDAGQPPLEPLRLELQELRAQLERERLQRLAVEERLRLAEQPHSPQQEQQQQQQHRVHMCFKKPRLESTPPQLIMTERLLTPAAEESPPPPPQPQQQPPVVSHRPLYMGSTTSRQNLDTIVEAIRHLEGDHLFGDSPEPIQTRLEPIQTRLEPIQTRLEPIQTRLEPVQTRLEPMQACLEPQQIHLEPLQTHLEPQEAPLELTTHARAVDPYRPGVIVAQHCQPHH